MFTSFSIPFLLAQFRDSDLSKQVTYANKYVDLPSFAEHLAVQTEHQVRVQDLLHKQDATLVEVHTIYNDCCELWKKLYHSFLISNPPYHFLPLSLVPLFALTGILRALNAKLGDLSSIEEDDSNNKNAQSLLHKQELSDTDYHSVFSSIHAISSKQLKNLVNDISNFLNKALVRTSDFPIFSTVAISSFPGCFLELFPVAFIFHISHLCTFLSNLQYSKNLYTFLFHTFLACIDSSWVCASPNSEPYCQPIISPLHLLYPNQSITITNAVITEWVQHPLYQAVPRLIRCITRLFPFLSPSLQIECLRLLHCALRTSFTAWDTYTKHNLKSSSDADTNTAPQIHHNILDKTIIRHFHTTLFLSVMLYMAAYLLSSLSFSGITHSSRSFLATPPLDVHLPLVFPLIVDIVAYGQVYTTKIAFQPYLFILEYFILANSPILSAKRSLLPVIPMVQYLLSPFPSISSPRIFPMLRSKFDAVYYIEELQPRDRKQCVSILIRNYLIPRLDDSFYITFPACSSESSLLPPLPALPPYWQSLCEFPTKPKTNKIGSASVSTSPLLLSRDSFHLQFLYEWRDYISLDDALHVVVPLCATYFAASSSSVYRAAHLLYISLFTRFSHVNELSLTCPKYFRFLLHSTPTSIAFPVALQCFLQLFENISAKNPDAENINEFYDYLFEELLKEVQQYSKLANPKEHLASQSSTTVTAPRTSDLNSIPLSIRQHFLLYLQLLQYIPLSKLDLNISRLSEIMGFTPVNARPAFANLIYAMLSRSYDLYRRDALIQWYFQFISTINK